MSDTTAKAASPKQQMTLPTLPLRRDPGSGSADAAATGPQRVLVLGATSGIAEACIRLWAQRGDHLYLVARDAARLAAVAADAQVRGAGLVAQMAADLDQTAGHPALLQHAVQVLGGIDLAVLAFGALGDADLMQTDYPAAAALLHTNLLAPVSCITWLAGYFQARHAGTLAVFSSVAGDRGRQSNYVYGASKAGLSAYLSGLRNRLDREGVRVMTIKPGPVRTAMTESMPGSAGFADVGAVAATIVKAIDRGQDVLYVPGIWRIIMAVIGLIPESLFKRLNL